RLGEGEARAQLGHRAGDPAPAAGRARARVAQLLDRGIMKSKRKGTSDAGEILERLLLEGRSGRVRRPEGARVSGSIAREVYRMREEAGLTQRALAKLVGTTASVICRLEDDDYEGHSLGMLRRIAHALGKRVEIRIVPATKKPKSA